MNKFTNWFKQQNMKKIIKGFTLIWGLVLIIVMTITNLGIKDKFDFLEWLGNSLIIFGIMVFGLFLGESIGKDKQSEKDDGLFQVNLKKYKDLREKIDSIICYFVQFFQWFMPQELEVKKINYLVMAGMNQDKAERIVKYLTLDDYTKILNGALQLENGLVVRKLQDYEKEATLKVLRGDIRLDASNPNYYLTAFAKSNSLSMLEIGKQLDRDIIFVRRSNRVIKLTVSMIVSVLFAILTVKEFMDTGDAQAWVNLISRITALCTSLLSGWLSATIEVKLEAEKLANKYNVLSMFNRCYEKRLFVPKSEHELEQEELAEAEKEKENVVTPDVVNEEKVVNSEVLNDGEIITLPYKPVKN